MLPRRQRRINAPHLIQTRDGFADIGQILIYWTPIAPLLLILVETPMMLSLLKIRILHLIGTKKRHGNIAMVYRLLLLDFHLLLFDDAHLLRNTVLQWWCIYVIVIV